ncbi:uncharacterized protein BX664DRAFT_65090 [Halteromyces radiatus]|uniref:uncharacterized protein n=1 Tax=Halteromyces radiatus TaxID=101107 RepID=UPI00221E73B0|nr:uncharacterized protein BX664DRAFT_65090 [Halteromyces radiatus]KAI8096721.1 hypothetical protein BX664DRAFT_65090 [Halteromyces radiatus]
MLNNSSSFFVVVPIIYTLIHYLSMLFLFGCLIHLFPYIPTCILQLLLFLLYLYRQG